MVLYSKALIQCRSQYKLLSSNNLKAVYSACRRRENSTTENGNRTTSDQSGNKGPRSKSYAAGLASVTCVAAVSYYLYRQNLDSLEESHISPSNRGPADLPTYTRREVGEHRGGSRGIWATYGRGVYDLTEYAKLHPAGEETIAMAAGAAIEPFWKEYGFHKKPEVLRLLETTRIGNLDEREVEREAKSDRCKPPAVIPRVNLEHYRLVVIVGDVTVKKLTLEDVKLYPKHTIVSNIPCKSNSGQMTNGPTWTGARLCDVLRDLVAKRDEYDQVRFEYLDPYKPGYECAYGTSVPLDKVLSGSEKEQPELEVLLAYEMDGAELAPDHGYPIRLVMPQLAGAKNIKWLSRICLKKRMNEDTESKKDS